MFKNLVKVALRNLMRQKEIGIRKVLGASVGSILLHLVGDFTKWILIANLIAWPFVWYAASKWLQSFAYHINLNILTFMFTGILALLIAFITISFRTIRAVNSNPIKALKYE